MLVLLLAIGFIDTQTGETAAPRVEPRGQQRTHARELLADLPALTEAIGTGTLDDWSTRTAATVAAGVELAADTSTAEAWQDIADALGQLDTTRESGDRDQLLRAAGTYSAAVMALARLER